MSTTIKNKSLRLTVDEKIKDIKKLFLEKDIDTLPCALVKEVYERLCKEYKTPLAGMMGIYLMGSHHEDSENDG